MARELLWERDDDLKLVDFVDVSQTYVQSRAASYWADQRAHAHIDEALSWARRISQKVELTQ